MRMIEVEGAFPGERPQIDDDEEQGANIILKDPTLTYNASHNELNNQDLAELPPGQEEQCISFQNANFIFKISRSTPLEI